MSSKSLPTLPPCFSWYRTESRVLKTNGSPYARKAVLGFAIVQDVLCPLERKEKAQTACYTANYSLARQNLGVITAKALSSIINIFQHRSYDTFERSL